MPKYEIGDRVGAVRNATTEEVFFYGWGTYQGEQHGNDPASQR